VAFDGRVLNGIGVLAAVVEAGTFRKAATALNLTQSGVSRAIARLEERVGVRIVQRNSRAVTLTDEGRRFYEAVAPLMTGIEEAATQAAGASGKPKGLLRVAADALVAREVICPNIDEWLALNPELTVDLVVRDHLGDLVADGFDVAVRFGEPEQSALVTRRLLDTRVVTCAARDYLERRGKPPHPRALAKHDCIHFRDPQTGQPYAWVFQRGKKTLAVKVHGRLILNDSAAKLAACAAGHGITQILELELLRHPELGLVDLFPDWPGERFPLQVYYPSRHHAPAKVRAFVDFSVAALKKLGLHDRKSSPV
jgi:DNA-binding transcriptional LysR family regulator